MNKIKIAIIGASYTSNSKDLKVAIENAKGECFFVNLSSLTFAVENKKFLIRSSVVDLDKIDIFIFRGFNSNILEARILARRLIDNKKIVIDEVISSKYIESKILQCQVLKDNGINVPETFQALNCDAWIEHLKKENFPVIIKPICGRKGEGVIKIDNFEDAVMFFKRNPKGFFLQEYLPVDGDFRIFVVGNKVIGGIKRNCPPGDFRSNVAVGGKAEKINVTKDIKEIALRASHCLGYEIAGVDILQYKNIYYTLEVNIAPQWEGFKKCTGINPAEHIVEYALDRYYQSKL